MFNEMIENYKQIIFKKGMFTEHKQHIFRQIKQCRTDSLGGHIYKCEKCGTTHLLNNSCRNRNCPVCQGEKRMKWVNKQCNNLLNVPYYHVIFTLPKILNELFLQFETECYNILYHSAWESLKLLFTTQKIQGGMICIMHTWGQNLTLHPHLHCIVPSAGLNKSGELEILRSKDKFLFNVKSLSRIFRAKFVEKLTKSEKQNKLKIGSNRRMQLFEKQWVVNIQKPFGKPEIVVQYIGRYTHSIAISERRILSYDDEKVIFSYKNYKQNGEIQQMQLDPEEFLRRFALHILPFRFVKIRHYGVLSNSNRKKFVATGEKKVGKFKIENAENEEYPDEDEHYFEAKRKFKRCPCCKEFALRKLFSFSGSDLKTGIAIIDGSSGEIVYQSRAGPIDETVIIRKINEKH